MLTKPSPGSGKGASGTSWRRVTTAKTSGRALLGATRALHGTVAPAAKIGYSGHKSLSFRALSARGRPAALAGRGQSDVSGFYKSSYVSGLTRHAVQAALAITGKTGVIAFEKRRYGFSASYGPDAGGFKAPAEAQLGIASADQAVFVGEVLVVIY